MNKLKNLLHSPYFYSMGNKFIYCILSFLASALFTRSLGLQLKGEYTWYINFASILSIILGLGVYHSMSYYMRIELEKNWTQEYINIFYVKAVFFLCVLLCILFFFPQKKQLLLIGLLTIADTLSQELSMLLIIEKLNWKNKLYLLGAFINFLLSILCFSFAKENLIIALSCYVGIKIFYIISYTCAIGIVPHVKQISYAKIIEKIKFGYLPMFSFLLITANYRIDVLMLESASNVSASQLSLYSAGVSLAEIGWVVPDVFKEVLFSRIAKKKNDSEVSSALRVSNTIIVFIILCIIAFGKQVIHIFYGAEFIPAYVVTILLFLGIPAMSWFKMIYQLFNAKGKRKTSFWVLLASTIINIIFNYLLIPMWAINGAAIASIISYVVCGFLFLVLYAHSVNVKVWTLFIPTWKDIKLLFNNTKG